jgi:preprotein translocase subunit YajC
MSEGPMFITPAYAQAAGATQASSAGLFASLAPMLLIFVVFYFLMIRPQQKRQRALQDAVQGVKKGDSVVTAGGILGKATKVEDTVVEVEIAPNTRIRVVKATIAEVTPLGSKPAND